MSAFEDTCELWFNGLDHNDVLTVEGPTTIETLQEARDRFVKLGNDPIDGCLVIGSDFALEMSEGWVEITGPMVPLGHEEFDPFDEIVTITDDVVGGAILVRSDAVRLDMTILDPDGVVVIDFGRCDPDA